jgi:hypothetical protein
MNVSNIKCRSSNIRSEDESDEYLRWLFPSIGREVLLLAKLFFMVIMFKHWQKRWCIADFEYIGLVLVSYTVHSDRNGLRWAVLAKLCQFFIHIDHVVGHERFMVYLVFRPAPFPKHGVD